MKQSKQYTKGLLYNFFRFGNEKSQSENYKYYKEGRKPDVCKFFSIMILSFKDR